MKKKIYLIVILVGVLMVEGIFIKVFVGTKSSEKNNSYTNINNKDNDNDNSVDNNQSDSNINDDSVNTLVSLESMRELAKNKDLHIMDESLGMIDGGDVEFDWYQGYGTLSLRLKNNVLYLIDESNHESKVTDIDEKVIMVIGHGECDSWSANTLILTEKGNLFFLKGQHAGGKIDKETFNKLQNNESVSLNLKKINPSDVKVLAFVDLHGDSRGFTCGTATQYIYTNKGFMDYKDMKEAEKVIVDAMGYGVFDDIVDGFVIYDDGTVSANNKDLIKSKNGGNLIVKSYYYGNEKDDGRNFYHILGVDDYLYTEDSDGSIVISEAKVNDIMKEKGRIVFKFEDGSDLEVVNELNDFLER